MSIVRNIAMFAVLLACVGCGHGEHELATARVSGRINFDEKPLEWGTVIFTPERGRSASGLIQADGSYELTTYSQGDGALVGRHEVTIICTDRKPDATKNFSDVGQVAKWLIPKRYGQPSSSGLHFTVEPNQDNVANFDLKSQ